jgi:hypothetical protein
LPSSSTVRAHPSSKLKIQDIERLIFDFRGRAASRAVRSRSAAAGSATGPSSKNWTDTCGPQINQRPARGQNCGSRWSEGGANLKSSSIPLTESSPSRAPPAAGCPQLVAHLQRVACFILRDCQASLRVQLIRLRLHVVTAVLSISQDSGRPAP